MAEYFALVAVLKFHLVFFLLTASCSAAPTAAPNVPTISSPANNSTAAVKLENETDLNYLNRSKAKCSRFEPQVVLDFCKDKSNSICNLAMTLTSFACQKYPDSAVPNAFEISGENGNFCDELRSDTTMQLFMILRLDTKSMPLKLNPNDLNDMKDNCDKRCSDNDQLCRNALHTFRLLKTYFVMSVTPTSSVAPAKDIDLPPKADNPVSSPKTTGTLGLESSTKEPSKSNNFSSNTPVPKVDIQSTSDVQKSSSESMMTSSSVAAIGDQTASSSKSPFVPSANADILGEDPEYMEPPMPEVPLTKEDDEDQPVLEDKEDQEQAIDRDDDLDDDQLADPDLTLKNEAAAPALPPKDVVPDRVAEPHMKTSTYAIGETAEDTHFFVYFLVALVLTVTGYLAFHNKHKILALLLEGRRRRVTSTRSGRSAAYRKLDSSLEEVMTSSRKADASDVIY